MKKTTRLAIIGISCLFVIVVISFGVLFFTFEPDDTIGTMSPQEIAEIKEKLQIPGKIKLQEILKPNDTIACLLYTYNAELSTNDRFSMRRQLAELKIRNNADVYWSLSVLNDRNELRFGLFPTVKFTPEAKDDLCYTSNDIVNIVLNTDSTVPPYSLRFSIEE